MFGGWKEKLIKQKQKLSATSYAQTLPCAKIKPLSCTLPMIKENIIPMER